MKKIGVFIVVVGFSFLNGGETMSRQLQNVHKACDNDIASACFELGELYREGTGVEKDLMQAKSYYTKACEGGFDAACSKLEVLKDESSDEK